MEEDHDQEANGSNMKKVKFDHKANIEETVSLDNHYSPYQIAQWTWRKVMLLKHLNQQQLQWLVLRIQELISGASSFIELTGQHPDGGGKRKRDLKLEIQELIEEQERMSGCNRPDTSEPDPPVHDYDALTDFRIKLEQMTKDKQTEQQDQHLKSLKEKKLRHEQQMKEMWNNFNHAMNDKIRKDKEEFSNWSSNPD